MSLLAQSQAVIPFNSYEDFKNYLDEYERQTTSHFIMMKKEKRFSESEWKGKRLHWMDDKEKSFCIPYVIIGQLLLGCHQGKDKNVGKKEKYRKQTAERRRESPGTIRSRLMAQSTKKLDCPATISLKKIAKFPEFTQDLDSTGWARRKVVREFSHSVKDEREIKVVFEFQAKFPSPDAHQYHVQGEFAGMREPIDPLVRNKVADLVKKGVTQVSDIQGMVRDFVAHELFHNKSPPSEMRRRYNPTKRDILNISYMVRNKMYQHRPKPRKKGRGQERERDSLHNFASKRRILAPDDLMFLPIAEEGVDSDEQETSMIGSSRASKLLFCYQTLIQQRLLGMYGSLLVMDITQPSAKVPGAPVFLYVRTNVDFQLVGVFIMREMDFGALEEGLSRIQEWNCGWRPEFLLMELVAWRKNVVQKVFPDVSVYACDAHFEKMMSDRVFQSDPGVLPLQVSNTVALVCKVVRATTVDQCECALAELKASEGFILPGKLQHWLTALLDMQDSWIPLRRPEKLSVLLCAMNGVEKLGELLRADLLRDVSTANLGIVVKALVTKIVPDFYRRYVQDNVRGSSCYGKLHKSLPRYLENRPMSLVNHVKARLSSAQTLVAGITRIKDGTYSVPASDMTREQCSVVDLGDEARYPSCQCSDWMHHRLPCQHLLAVMHHLGEHDSWEPLSRLYGSNPIFSLDRDCIMKQVQGRVSGMDTAGDIVGSATAASAGSAETKAKREIGASSLNEGEQGTGDKGVSILKSVAFEMIEATDTGSSTTNATGQAAPSAGTDEATRPQDDDESSVEMTIDSEDLCSSAENGAQETSASTPHTPLSETRSLRISGKRNTKLSVEISGKKNTRRRAGADLAPSTNLTLPEAKSSLVVMRHRCGMKLEKLIEVIPTITDCSVLERVVGHLQLALQESGHSSET